MGYYYHTCPYCGANLDPGEICDCNGLLPHIQKRYTTLKGPLVGTFFTADGYNVGGVGLHK